jgi:predicted dinucleotide-binding enzyme
MNVGVLGTGEVGRALASAFIKLGHEVKMGSRTANNDKALAWVKQAGAAASAGTFAEAAESAEVIVLATLGVATESAIALAGAPRFAGKVVIDTTNPLDFSGGMPPTLSIGTSDSLGERIQNAIPEAHVVKAFNTVGNAFMFKPDFPGGPPDMFICGDSADAKRQVSAILEDFGWGVVDLGGIISSRYLEPMCMAWVMYGLTSGSWSHAFKLLRQSG